MVAGAAEGDQVVGIVAAALRAGGDVVDFEESGVVTTNGAAPMAVAGKYQAPFGRWDGGPVGLSLFRDITVAMSPLLRGMVDDQITFRGGNRRGLAGRALMEMDLERGPRGAFSVLSTRLSKASSTTSVRSFSDKASISFS
jgi:hypothetical protein